MVTRHLKQCLTVVPGGGCIADTMKTKKNTMNFYNYLNTNSKCAHIFVIANEFHR